METQSRISVELCACPRARHNAESSAQDIGSFGAGVLGIVGPDFEAVDITAQSQSSSQTSAPFDFALSKDAEGSLPDTVFANRARSLSTDSVIERDIANGVVAKVS